MSTKAFLSHINDHVRDPSCSGSSIEAERYASKYVFRTSRHCEQSHGGR